MEDLTIKVRLEALITEREGMIAMNKEREHRGEALAYGEQAFFALEDRINELIK